MPEPFRIFIGWDSREAECADVMAYSIREHATCAVDIRLLKEPACRDLLGYNPIPRGASTEFTYTRFLIPYICGYQGTALFTDCDMVCYGDVGDLQRQALDWSAAAEQGGGRWSLACVKHEPQRITGAVKMDGQPQIWYPRKNWSSVMLLNCAALTLWTKAIVEHAPGAYLHRFLDIPDDEIRSLDPAWNELYELGPDTKIRHWTEGGPWFEECRDCQDADEWLKWRDDYRASRAQQELQP